ncbi:hypothetical protein E2C01_022849 [Portunus trituberculatus]
MNTTE